MVRGRLPDKRFREASNVSASQWARFGAAIAIRRIVSREATGSRYEVTLCRDMGAPESSGPRQ